MHTKILASRLPSLCQLAGALTFASFCLVGHLPATTILSYHDGEQGGMPEVVGSGHVISETRAVTGFHGIDQTLPMDLVVTQGDSESLTLEGEDNILPLVDTSVDKDGILHLEIKHHAGSVRFEKPLVCKLALKTLDAVTLKASGSLRSASLHCEHLALRILGSAQVKVHHLTAQTLDAEVLGAGTVTLIGQAQTQKLTINGSGDYAGRDFQTQDTEVQVNGSGKAQVWADATLDASINGAGDVGYRGSAKVTKAVHGAGEIHQLKATKEE